MQYTCYGVRIKVKSLNTTTMYKGKYLFVVSGLFEIFSFALVKRSKCKGVNYNHIECNFEVNIEISAFNQVKV